MIIKNYSNDSKYYQIIFDDMTLNNNFQPYVEKCLKSMYDKIVNGFYVEYNDYDGEEFVINRNTDNDENVENVVDNTIQFIPKNEKNHLPMILVDKTYYNQYKDEINNEIVEFEAEMIISIIIDYIDKKGLAMYIMGYDIMSENKIVLFIDKRYDIDYEIVKMSTPYKSSECKQLPRCDTFLFTPENKRISTYLLKFIFKNSL